MKVSKVRWTRIILWTLILGTALGGGFYFGAFPEKRWGSQRQPVRLCLSQDLIISKSWVALFFEKSKIPLNLSPTNTQSIDWTKCDFTLLLSSQLQKDSEFASLESLKSKLSSQFSTGEILKLPGMPVGWKGEEETKNILLLLLATGPMNPSREDFLEAFFDSSLVFSLLKELQFRSTLSRQLYPLTPPELSPQNLRDFPLNEWRLQLGRD
ncbi:MAG: hypothetical protein LW875_07280 [Proteobacteria bacterium]|jgi:hypothetical protein|nr:hypothetical protein [Pseudomonadota bacterium]